MSSKREQIMVALEALLKTVTAGGISSANIVRTRLAPFEIPDMPAIRIEQGQAVADEIKIGKLDWKMIVKVKTFHFGPVPDTAADPIVDSVHQKLMAANALGLTFIEAIVPKDLDPSFDFGDQPFVEFTQEFEINYETSKGET